jgi:hypothetical protein
MSAGVAGTTFRPNPAYTTLRDVTSDVTDEPKPTASLDATAAPAA